MGLDMYLDGRKYIWQKYSEAECMEDGYPLKEKLLMLGYWRKHPNLHGFIVREFAEGQDNCEPILLSEDEMRKIIQAVKDKALPETTGFFFGKSDGSEDEETIEILEKAIAWAAVEEDGVTRYVEYCASW